MRRPLGAAVLLALLLAAPALAAPTPPLSQKGRWITDAHGRVAILHGVNMVYKRPPYHPLVPGFGEDDARFLARHGFNNVRLGLIYAGVEPEPGEYDQRYLGKIRRVERLLAEHRVFSLLDFHQDLFNERFQGEGFPDWAVQDDGLPAEPKLGFPANYLLMPALNRAFDHFWANDPAPDGIGLQDHYARAWRVVAQRFRDQPWAMGYDLFNEPWPGSVYPTCMNTAGCPLFETGPLASMHRKATRQIRKVDRRHIVFGEPEVIFNNGADSSLPDFGRGPTGFSFHDYCLLVNELGPELPLSDPGCRFFDGLVFDNADEQAEETGQALLLSEFGATTNQPAIKRVIDLADEHMVSWQWWHYCGCDDPTTSGPGDTQAIVRDLRKPPRGRNVIRDKLALIERPYPQAVNGTPRSFSFNRETRAFELTYSPTAPGGERLPRSLATAVYIPRIHYPDGYRVEVTGATAVSRPGARILKLRRRAGDGVTLRVLPR